MEDITLDRICGAVRAAVLNANREIIREGVLIVEAGADLSGLSRTIWKHIGHTVYIFNMRGAECVASKKTPADDEHTICFCAVNIFNQERRELILKELVELWGKDFDIKLHSHDGSAAHMHYIVTYIERNS